MAVGWGALYRSPDRTAAAIPHTAMFEPGATYRVLTFGDAKYGQYAVVRAGGRLDSEFFPESLYRGNFKDDEAYARFLTDRKVDYVVVDRRYQRFRTNEPRILGEMAALTGDVACVNGVLVRERDETVSLVVYRVTRGCQPAKPS
jgi:hypothetical protein